MRVLRQSPRTRNLALIVVSATLLGCSGHDADYMPYLLKGMNSYVYDEDGRDYFAGYSEGNYLEREDVLVSCASNARSKAYDLGIIDANWSYICCTVTADSSCATKVR